MIKNIVFDLGNVLVSFDPYPYFLNIFHDQELVNRICQHIFCDDAWTSYDAGLVTIQDLNIYYRQKYPEEEQEIEYVLEHWTAFMKGMDESIAYLCNLKNRGYHIYLLSNINEDSAIYLKQRLAIFDKIDGAILSYEHKIVKPDPKIYQILFDTYHLDPKTCVFLDDREENITVARQLHMKGIVFTNPTEAFQELEEIVKKEEVEC